MHSYKLLLPLHISDMSLSFIVSIIYIYIPFPNQIHIHIPIHIHIHINTHTYLYIYIYHRCRDIATSSIIPYQFGKTYIGCLLSKELNIKCCWSLIINPFMVKQAPIYLCKLLSLHTLNATTIWDQKFSHISRMPFWMIWQMLLCSFRTLSLYQLNVSLSSITLSIWRPPWQNYLTEYKSGLNFLFQFDTHCTQTLMLVKSILHTLCIVETY